MAVCRRTGNILVADSKNERVQLFDDKCKHIKDITHIRMKIPTHVAVNSRGHIFVSDCGRNEVFVFSGAGEFMRLLCGVSWDTPLGVVLDSEDNIYVCNSGRHSIEVFDSDCNYIRAFGESGSESGQFSGEPNYVAVHGHKIIVSDNTGRLYQFNKLGTFTKDYIISISGVVRGLAFYRKRMLVVVNRNKKNLVAVRTNRMWHHIGDCGDQPWQLRNPNGVAFSPSGHKVIVANTHNHNILVYKIVKKICIQ